MQALFFWGLCGTHGVSRLHFLCRPAYTSLICFIAVTSQVLSADSFMERVCVARPG